MTTAVVQKKNSAEIKKMFANYEHKIAASLPKHMSAERMIEVATTVIRNNTRLANADPMTLVGAVIKASELGLDLAEALGQAYLIPFDSSKAGMQAKLVIGYRGLITLLIRGKQVETIMPRLVYEGDEFDVLYGHEDRIHHRPRFKTTNVQFAYAIATTSTGAKQFVVLDRRALDEAKNASPAVQRAERQSKKSGKPVETFDSPWFKYPEAMMLKTAIRRLANYLSMEVTPETAHINEAVMNDEIVYKYDGGLVEIPEEVDIETEDEPKKKTKAEESDKSDEEAPTDNDAEDKDNSEGDKENPKEAEDQGKAPKPKAKEVSKEDLKKDIANKLKGDKGKEKEEDSGQERGFKLL